jgi:hypothetical protein
VCARSEGLRKRWATREKRIKKNQEEEKRGRRINENETVGVDLGHKPENRQTGNN